MTKKQAAERRVVRAAMRWYEVTDRVTAETTDLFKACKFYSKHDKTARSLAKPSRRNGGREYETIFYEFSARGA